MFHLLSGFNKVFKFEQFKTDNYTFRFFYKFALWLHILFLVLLSAKQYFGEPIVCHTRPNDVSFQFTNEPQIPISRNCNFLQIRKDIFDSYCWIYGTYTRKEYLLPRANFTTFEGSTATHPGQGIHMADTETEKITHHHYQWIPFLMFFYSVRILENKQCCEHLFY